VVLLALVIPLNSYTPVDILLPSKIFLSISVNDNKGFSLTILTNNLPVVTPV
jgi:hypothetical protein